jgi:hypothetical protein
VTTPWAGQWRFISWRGQEIFLFSIPPTLALEPTHPPVQYVLGAVSLGVKQQGCEADHSPPSSSKNKNDGAIHPFPHIPTWHSVYTGMFLPLLATSQRLVHRRL